MLSNFFRVGHSKAPKVIGNQTLVGAGNATPLAELENPTCSVSSYICLSPSIDVLNTFQQITVSVPETLTRLLLKIKGAGAPMLLHQSLNVEGAEREQTG